MTGRGIYRYIGTRRLQPRLGPRLFYFIIIIYSSLFGKVETFSYISFSARAQTGSLLQFLSCNKCGNRSLLKASLASQMINANNAQHWPALNLDRYSRLIECGCYCVDRDRVIWICSGCRDITDDGQLAVRRIERWHIDE